MADHGVSHWRGRDSRLIWMLIWMDGEERCRRNDVNSKRPQRSQPWRDEEQRSISMENGEKRRGKKKEGQKREKSRVFDLKRETDRRMRTDRKKKESLVAAQRLGDARWDRA
jgi:hypothetical protein